MQVKLTIGYSDRTFYRDGIDFDDTKALFNVGFPLLIEILLIKQ